MCDEFIFCSESNILSSPRFLLFPQPPPWFATYFWLECIIIDCVYDEMCTLLAFILK